MTEASAPVLAIGALARETGAAVDTIRYYERRGLLPAPARTTSGRRAYPSSAIERLAFIRRARRLGFSIPAIGDLLMLRDEASSVDPEKAASAVFRTFSEIDARVAELGALREELREKLGVATTGAR